MIFALIVLWGALTAIMFYCCKMHNKSVVVEFTRVTWEPYVFSVGIAAIMIAYI